MRTGNDTNGNPLFTYQYFLTSTQIATLFSRLVSKKSLANEDEVVKDDLNSAASETEMEKLTSVAALEAGLTHLITYDVYSLCGMSSKSKLKNLSISQPRDICESYDIDVNEVTVKRKLPYIECSATSTDLWSQPR